jgi:PAS domain S-box-containing protein
VDEDGKGRAVGRSGPEDQRAPLLVRTSALATLHAVADAVHRSLDVHSVAAAAIGALRAYKPFSAASILVLSDDRSQLLTVAAEGFAPDMQREGLPVEGSLVGLAILRGELLTVDDLSRETRGIPEMLAALVRDGFRSATIVPLVQDGEPVGVLTLASRDALPPSAEERDTLLVVGRTIALAIDNARQVEELRERDRRFAMATSAARIGVWDWRVATGEFYVDPNAKALLGYTDAEIPNDLPQWSAHVHPADRAAVEEAVRAHLDGQTPEFVCEHRMLHKDGTVRWVLARGHGLRDDRGEVVRLIGTDADITERKQLERERRELELQMLHAEKLRSLGVLAGGIAHEFNNLLTAILGNAGLAHREAEPGSRTRRRVEQIEAAAQRAADLTRQLLAYSGRGTFVLERVDLSQLVREMADLLRLSLPKHVRLTVDCAAHLPAIHGDPGQWRQLLVNLVHNAAEAIEGGEGSVVVRTGVESAPAAPGRAVFLEVTDDGCGIAEPDRERIFEPFFTTKVAGRGLGLAAVAGIVRGHGGTIDLVSGSSRGSTFRVRVPALESGPEQGGAGGASLAGRTVLVVDEEPAVLELARTVLERAGCAVLTAGNGVDALALYDHDPQGIDAVLLDLTLPSLGGLETLRALRAIRPDARVILSSGYGVGEAFEEADRLAVAGLLDKPYDPARLVQEVRRALGTVLPPGSRVED